MRTATRSVIDMTIDEAIKQARYVSDENSDCWINCENIKKCCKECEYEHEQLAEWLEELKALRYGLKIKCDSLNDALEKGKKVGYNKAVDECLAVLYKNAGKIISIRFYEQIFDEMKQLKAGRENEQNKQNT